MSSRRSKRTTRLLAILINFQRHSLIVINSGSAVLIRNSRRKTACFMIDRRSTQLRGRSSNKSGWSRINSIRKGCACPYMNDYISNPNKKDPPKHSDPKTTMKLKRLAFWKSHQLARTSVSDYTKGAWSKKSSESFSWEKKGLSKCATKSTKRHSTLLQTRMKEAVRRRQRRCF